MRRRNNDIHARVNGRLKIRFDGQGLTSFAGLELFAAYLRTIDFSGRLRRHLRGLKIGGDFKPAAMVRLLIAMFVVGGSRLAHVRHLVGDPIVSRFSNLAVLPAARTVSRWLARCKPSIRAALLALNAEVIAEALRPLRLRRLTVDVDGTVVSTGLKVERAFRGFNPHRRKVPSYYPITAHLAQTGHVLRVKNRSGNVHDGKASPAFLRELFTQLEELDPSALIEVRLDAAFFRREIIAWLERRAEYAIKVPFFFWLGLKSVIRKQKRWTAIRPGLEGFMTELPIEPWNMTARVAVYRKRVAHKSPKNFQLDLFDPNDGHWEYSAVTTNKSLGLKALWDFMAGRGCHEKVLAELKTGYAFDTVPTQNYVANSAWQVLSILSHNLVINFQIATGAARRRLTAKRSPIFLLQSIRTVRYELMNRAGMLKRPAGRRILHLAPNEATRRVVERVQQHLAA